MSLFFISYKRQDVNFALQVKDFVERIPNREYLCWIDREGISAGDEWKRAIDSAINQSLGIIVIVTPEALKSPYVTYEWSFAMGMGKRIIPLILTQPTAEEMHPKLNDLHVLFFTSEDKSEHEWDALEKELSEITERHEIPPSIQVMRQKVYDNIFDEKVWGQMVKTLSSFEHPAANEVLAEFMDAGLPSLSVEACIAFARKTEYTDLRAIPYLQKAIDNNLTREACADIVVKYPPENSIEVMVESFHQLPSHKHIEHVHHWTSKASDKLQLQYCEYIFENVMKNTAWRKYFVSMLQSLEVAFLERLVAFATDDNEMEIDFRYGVTYAIHDVVTDTNSDSTWYREEPARSIIQELIDSYHSWDSDSLKSAVQKAISG